MSFSVGHIEILIVFEQYITTLYIHLKLNYARAIGCD